MRQLHDDRRDETSAADRRFDDLVCQLTTCLETGQHVDIEQFAAEHPEFSQRLRDLFPTLQAMHDLGHTLLAGASVAAREGKVDGGTAGQLTGSLGDFRLIRELGRGGMGVVYEAEQISLGRRVALKILPFAGVLNPRQLQRFKNEALAAAQLDHPHIVDVLGVGCERSVHYYAMRLIDGQPLSEIIAAHSASAAFTARRDQTVGRHSDRPDPFQDTESLSLTRISGTSATSSSTFFRSVARLGIQVAEALDFAHENGVIHRDIKPANLLLDNKGNAWITDFGLAQIETSAELTLTGDLVGTLRYMSPEQALGKRVVVDHRTDIYSLGTTLYELIAGRPAFAHEERSELLRRISFEEPPPLRRLNKSVPVELATVVQKCMAKNAMDRYQAAIDLADDLRRYLDHRPIQARSPTLLDQTLKWSIRHRTTVLWLVILLAVTTVISTYSAIRLASVGSKVLGAQQETKEHLWDSYLAQASATRRTGEAGQRFDGLEALRKAVHLIPDRELSDDQRLQLRNEAVALTALTDVRISQRIDLSQNARRGFLDKQFRRIAVADRSGEMTIQRLSDRQTLITIPSSGQIIRAEFSTLADILAVQYDSQSASRSICVVWNLPDGRPVCKFEMQRNGIFDFSADGSLLAAPLLDGSVTVFDATSGQKKHRLSMNKMPRIVAFCPDGERLAIGSDNSGSVDVYRIEDGARLASLSHPQLPLHIDWSPDLLHLAVGCQDHCVHVWNVTSPSKALHVLRGHRAVVVKVAFGAQGKLLATHAHDATTRLWNPLRGSCECTMMGRFRGFHRSGNQFYWEVDSSAGWLGIYELAMPGLESLVVEPPHYVPAHLDFSDGLMVSAGLGGFRFWDLADRQQIAEIRDTGGVAFFHRPQRELITVSPRGLLAWPMRTGQGTIRIGPPRVLGDIAVPANACAASLCSQKNQIAVLSDWTRIQLVELASGRVLADFNDPAGGLRASRLEPGQQVVGDREPRR